MSKVKTPSPDYGPPPSAGDLFEAAVAAILADDEAAALEALRQLDEPQPRKVLGYFQLLLAEHARLAPIIAAGQGKADRAAQLDLARRSLRTSRPTSGEEAERIAADLLRLERDFHAASITASDAANAERMQQSIEALCPRLFGKPASRQFPSAGGLAPPSVVNWPGENNIELTYRDGWVYSALVAPPPGPRRRLKAIK